MLRNQSFSNLALKKLSFANDIKVVHDQEQTLTSKLTIIQSFLKVERAGERTRDLLISFSHSITLPQRPSIIKSSSTSCRFSHDAS
jgi:hypothetical protein